MSRFLLKLALLITLTLTITSLAARILGSTQPPNPALRGFTEGCEGQPQPCWYGIVLGITDIAIAQKQMESQGYKLYDSTNIYLYFSNQTGGASQAGTCSDITVSSEGNSPTVFSILLNQCDDVAFGDLSVIAFPKSRGAETVKLGEYFAAQLNVIQVVNNHFQRIEWSANTKVSSLDIAKHIELLGRAWHGFVPHWRYCQLEPDFTDCPQ